MCLLLGGGRGTRAGTEASAGDVGQSRRIEISKMGRATPSQRKPNETELKKEAKKKKPQHGRFLTVELKV